MTETAKEKPDRRGRVVLFSALLVLGFVVAAVALASIATPGATPASLSPDESDLTPPEVSPPTLLHTEPADLYVAPSARGAGDGSDVSNAAAFADLDRLVSVVGPGGVIELVQSQGAYVITAPVSIRHGGTAEDSITIRGPVTGPRPELVGQRGDPYTSDGNPGEPLFRLDAGADHLRFANLNCSRIGNGCFLVNAPIVDLTITSITARNVRRFFETGSADNGMRAMVTGLTIDQVEVTGFSKGAIRLGHDTHDVTITDVVGDSLSQDGDNFAIGVHLLDTVHNVVLERVSMNNALDTLHPYWNGDGFAAEETVYDITLIDTSASGNSDAGYDIKASNVEMVGVFASDNKRNYRLSGREITVEDCIGTDPHRRGGTGTQAQIHASGLAAVEVVNCHFADSSGATIVFDLDEHSRVSVVGGSISLGDGAVVSTVEPGATLDTQATGDDHQ